MLDSPFILVYYKKMILSGKFCFVLFSIIIISSSSLSGFPALDMVTCCLNALYSIVNVLHSNQFPLSIGLT